MRADKTGLVPNIHRTVSNPKFYLSSFAHFVAISRRDEARNRDCNILERLNGLFIVHSIKYIIQHIWAPILVQVSIYRRLRVSPDDYLDQSEIYDIS